VIAVQKVSLERFATWSVADVEDAIVRAADARREQRRFRHRLDTPDAELDVDALGSLARVLQRQGLRAVRDLGDAAVRAWARRVGIER
jgi:hypothetical protein